MGGSPCEIFRKGSRQEDFLYLYPSSYVCAGFVLFNFVLTYLLLIVVGNSYRTSKTIQTRAPVFIQTVLQTLLVYSQLWPNLVCTLYVSDLKPTETAGRNSKHFEWWFMHRKYMKTNKTPTSNNLVTNVAIEIQKDSSSWMLLELKYKEKTFSQKSHLLL